MSDRERYRVQALARGLYVLSCFTPEQPRLRVTDIAELSGLAMPTVFRLVRTLVYEGYLEELPGGELRPSLAVLRLGFTAVTGLDVVQAADTSLRQLAAKSNETVNLAVREGASIIYLLRIKNRDLVTADLRVGSQLPVQSSSMGKLLLALAPEQERDAIIDGLDLHLPQGPNAISDAARLQSELQAIRERGWSFQDQELAHGLRSIAAPVRDETGRPVAAINLAVAAHRYTMQALQERHLADLCEAATAISTRMGAPPEASSGADRDASSGDNRF